jgi:hypothetical protein
VRVLFLGGRRDARCCAAAMPAAVGGDVGEGVGVKGVVELAEVVESFDMAGGSDVEVMVNRDQGVIRG